MVTATTRPRRPNEVEGVDYYFVTKPEFQDLIARNELLEHAVVYGDYKGIPKKQVHFPLHFEGRGQVPTMSLNSLENYLQVSNVAHLFIIGISSSEFLYGGASIYKEIQ